MSSSMVATHGKEPGTVVLSVGEVVGRPEAAFKLDGKFNPGAMPLTAPLKAPILTMGFLSAGGGGVWDIKGDGFDDDDIMVVGSELTGGDTDIFFLIKEDSIYMRESLRCCKPFVKVDLIYLKFFHVTDTPKLLIGSTGSTILQVLKRNLLQSVIYAAVDADFPFERSMLYTFSAIDRNRFSTAFSSPWDSNVPPPF
jgi:hypothetical protein